MIRSGVCIFRAISSSIQSSELAGFAQSNWTRFRGAGQNHPATAVFDATRATETVITATLATLPNRLEQADTNAPCVVLIGEGVARPAYLSAASRQKRKTKCRA
jgi:siroheme synthase